MTIWQRIWQWLACRDPEDVDSGYPERLALWADAKEVLV